MRRAAMAAMMVAAMVGIAGRAEAGLIITFNEVGSDVTVASSGSLITEGLEVLLASGGFANAGIEPSAVRVSIGPINQSGLQRFRAYFSSDDAFGTGDYQAVTSGAGPLIAFFPIFNVINLPSTYASGAAFSNSSLFANQTFASLGVTPGTYSYSYSATQGGDLLDTITLQIGPAVAAVPEPGTLAGAGLGIALAAGAVVKRRRKVVAA